MLAVNLDLSDKTVLVVGGGAVGRRKLAKLLAAGAAVRLVEPAPAPEIAQMAQEGRIELESRFRPELLEGVSLAFLATNDGPLNREIARAAKTRGVWLNVADEPHEGDFSLPAVVERGAFTIAIATGGGGPALSAAVAERLREVFGPEYGCLAALLGALRPKVLAADLDGAARKSLLSSLARSPELLTALKGPDPAAALAALKQLLPPDLIDEDTLGRAVMKTHRQ